MSNILDMCEYRNKKSSEMARMWLEIEEIANSYEVEASVELKQFWTYLQVSERNGGTL